MPSTVAAHRAPWHRRRASNAAPPGAALAGLPFLTNVFGPQARILVEAALGATLTADPNTWGWYDITPYLRQAGGQVVAISPMGRSDESSQAQPAGCTFELDNTTGDWSKGPKSRWYPFIRQNTPLRVRLTIDGNSWYTRFQGEIKSWQPSWDTSAKLAIVAVTATGILRRLQSWTKPLRSALTRSILAAGNSSGNLRQFWPCEDESSATQATSALTGQPALIVGGTVRFAGMDYEKPAAPITLLPGTKFGTQPLPQLQAGGLLTASFSPGLSSSWTVQASIFTSPTVDTTLSVTLFSWNEINGTIWAVISDGVVADTVRLTRNGSTVITINHIIIQDDVRIDCNLRAANTVDVVFNIRATDPNYKASTTISADLSAVVSFTANPNKTVTTGDFSVGQVRIWDGNAAPDFKTLTTSVSAWNAYNGEAATDRLARLCSEERVGITIIGTSDTSMGTQKPDTFTNLIRMCEKTDYGLLHDGMGVGLTYYARSAQYNVRANLTLDAAAGQVDDPFQPIDDDQRILNRFEASRTDGGTGVYEQTTGRLGSDAIGQVLASDTLNFTTDVPLVGYAQWRVHIGVDESDYRYPTLNLDLAATPAIAPGWLNTSLTGHIDVINVDQTATQHPHNDPALLLEGYTEQLSPTTWTVQANCSPFQPWEVIELAADTGDTNQYVAHLDADDGAVTISGSYSPGATSITVRLLSTLTSQQFTISSDDFPFDLAIGGWKVHCTGAAAVVGTLGAGATQVLTVDPTPGQLYDGAEVHIWYPPVLAL